MGFGNLRGIKGVIFGRRGNFGNRFVFSVLFVDVRYWR